MYIVVGVNISIGILTAVLSVLVFYVVNRKCISLRNDIRNVFEKLHAHFEDCNRHLLDLEKVMVE